MSNETRELVVNRARPFIFSTAPTPLVAVHIRLAMAKALSQPDLGQRCLCNADQLRELLKGLEGPERSRSQILPVIVPGNEAAIAAAKRLQEQGFDVRAIRAPTVPPGTERLRLSVKATHSHHDLARLAEAIRGL